eukprot:5523192-Pleurochrysis_carterae.AAC.4
MQVSSTASLARTRVSEACAPTKESGCAPHLRDPRTRRPQVICARSARMHLVIWAGLLCDFSYIAHASRYAQILDAYDERVVFTSCRLPMLCEPSIGGWSSQLRKSNDLPFTVSSLPLSGGPFSRSQMRAASTSRNSTWLSHTF